MKLRAIRTDADLDWALAEIEQYFDTPPAPGTEEADRFDILTDLIEAYENREYPIEALDPIETLKAAEILVKEGFIVLPYINADPVLARRLQDVGTATVMPLGSPIGSHQGITTRKQIEIIITQATVPVVVDAGIGAPSHAAEALEMGADAVLVNTAIAIASDPPRMGIAFKMAVEAGRAAYEMGIADSSEEAIATSPLTTFLYQS
jgi:thiazole synthase